MIDNIYSMLLQMGNACFLRLLVVMELLSRI